MGLSVKVSLLTSFFFIGSMCWLVNQVGKPMVELPSPLTGVARSPAATAPLPVERPARGGFDRGQTRLSHASPAERAVPTPTWTAPAEPELAAGASLPPLAAPQPKGLQFASGAAPPNLVEAVQAAREAESQPPVAEPPAPAPQVATATAPPPQAEPEGAPDPVASEPRDYVIKRGDSLTRIARRLAPDQDETKVVAALLKANPRLKGRADLIRPGKTLVIPDFGADQPAQAPAVAAAPATSPRKASNSAARPKPDADSARKPAVASAAKKPEAPTGACEAPRVAAKPERASVSAGKPGAAKTPAAKPASVAAERSKRVKKPEAAPVARISSKKEKEIARGGKSPAPALRKMSPQAGREVAMAEKRAATSEKKRTPSRSSSKADRTKRQ